MDESVEYILELLCSCSYNRPNWYLNEILRSGALISITISSSLHLKVKYLFEDQIEEFVGSQSMARQCLVVAIMHKPEVESSASIEGGS